MDANDRPCWVLANEYPASSLPGEGDARFARLVSEATRGRLSIAARPGASLGYKSRDQLRAVARGEIAMADTFGGALAEEHAIFALASLPFVVADLVEARSLYDAARASYDAAFAESNQRLLYATPWPPSGIWSRVPVRTLEEIATLSIRTYDTTGCDLFRKLGARASVVSFVDLAARLADGGIDAVLSSGDGGAGRGLWKHLSRFTQIDYAIPLSFTTVNLDLWRLLDLETRAIVEGAAQEIEALQWRALEGRAAINYARMRSHGMTIETGIARELREQLREAARAAVDAWAAAAGPEAAALLKAPPRLDAAASGGAR